MLCISSLKLCRKSQQKQLVCIKTVGLSKFFRSHIFTHIFNNNIIRYWLFGMNKIFFMEVKLIQEIQELNEKTIF